MSRYIKVLNEDGAFTEKKVYLEEDMDSFVEWCSKNGWRYVESVVKEPCWERFDYTKSKWEESKTTDQLRGLWEEWKAKQGGEATE